MKFNFKKKYGQNFLVDDNILRKIDDLIEKESKSLVIEIGCGSGKLTKVLCNKFDYVLGYEIDLEVKDILFSNLLGFSNYEIIFDDFMNRDISLDLQKYNYNYLAVIANIPYYITTLILEKIIYSDTFPNHMMFMVQKEVADRLNAKVGDRNYNSFTIFLSYYYEIKKEFIVKKNSFYPVPNVDSAIVSFKKRKEVTYVKDKKFFYKLVRDSFRFNRKTIKNNLYDYDLDVVSKVLSLHGLDLSCRPSMISIDIYCEIANNLCSLV